MSEADRLSTCPECGAPTDGVHAWMGCVICPCGGDVSRPAQTKLDRLWKEAMERAAFAAYVTCAETRHVTLGRTAEKNILAIPRPAGWGEGGKGHE